MKYLLDTCMISELARHRPNENVVRWVDELDVDLGVMLEWGRLAGQLEAAGTPMPAMDALVAAIARHGDFVLVTRNEADFQHADVRLVNPWSM